ncbi:hypothetical protein PFFCH_02304 [Plasmodium falciparum FCH/4]|uniref:Uncharacterized protein n=1 Tax=Plasmodium falciparum FCH/4 TaxID=1036724 RepID=A0A024VPS0_PLAFA|nr:hypothetical protein PFFCH_02304 [Plasmodium falciparum FCH/4]
MIEQYESSFLGNFSSALKKIFTLGKSGRNPRNYNDLVNFSEVDYLLRTSKANNVQRIIMQIIRMLKKKFLSSSYTPTLLAQYMSIFLSLWVFEGENNISLQNPNISRFKKIFFLTYFVHEKGPVEKAVDIIYNKCRMKTDKIVLGCIHDYGGREKKKLLGLISRKCKPTKISIRKRSIRKILNKLMSSLNDPVDILRIAVDTATRCDHFNRSKNIDNVKTKKNKINYEIFVKSELSIRYICADVTSIQKIMNKLFKKARKKKKNMKKKKIGIYELQNNMRVSEFDYAIQNPDANIIVFDGNNYISSYALRNMGLEHERIVWAGPSVGWTAEFALSAISDNPLPIFDGSAWVLLEKLSIRSILGKHLPSDVNGNSLANTVNFVILNKDGKPILKNTTRKKEKKKFFVHFIFRKCR